MDDPVELAAGRFARGFNCAQSMLAAFAAQTGVGDDIALRLAAPFGAGMGRAGEACGALSGALMVLGVLYGTGRPEDKEAIYAITRAFVEQFREQHGAILCRELVGFDIATAEGLKAAREQDAFAKTCPLLVKETAQALARYIGEHPTKHAETEAR